MKRTIFDLLLSGCIAGLFLACPSPPNPGPIAPWPPDDATISPDFSCATVCQHYTALDCPAAKPTARGVPCETVCTNAQAVVKWNLACRSRAPSCQAADACEAK